MSDTVAAIDTNGTDHPFAVAVVLTWNDYEMAQTCIASLYENDYPNLKVVVVDNGSKFDTITPLTTAFPDLTVVALDKNYGFTGGCNRGLEKALEMGADYAFLLNNDTIVERSAISELVKTMEAEPDIGLASAIILDMGEPKQIQSYVGFVSPDRAFLVRPDEGNLLTSEYQVVKDTEFASACAIMFRRPLMEQLGLFDERLFTNWEDYDLCLRYCKAGHRITIVGTAEVQHRRHQTTGSRSPFITYYATRNRLICLFRHGRFWAIVRNTPFILRSFLWRVRGYGWGNFACHAAFCNAWIDFLLGVRGKGRAPSSRDDRETGKKR